MSIDTPCMKSVLAAFMGHLLDVIRSAPTSLQRHQNAIMLDPPIPTRRPSSMHYTAVRAKWDVDGVGQA